MLDRGMRFENLSIGEGRPTALIRRYGSLYAQSRVDTLDALDSIPELEHAHDLKSKILFSAVVVSYLQFLCKKKHISIHFQSFEEFKLAL